MKIKKSKKRCIMSIISLFIYVSLMLINTSVLADTVNSKDGSLDTNKEEQITKTPIMGKAEMTRGQAFSLLKLKNSTKSDEYIEQFTSLVWEEAQVEGVKPDIAFCQMMHETGYLKFGGDVKESQNNFAGIGAIGNGAPGNSFPSIQIGIRAVVQHLKAYACKDALKNECVDPRYQYVEPKGKAPNVEELTGSWAMDNLYDKKIMAIHAIGKTMSDHKATCQISNYNIVDIATNNQVVDGKLYKGKTYQIVAIANSSTTALYQFYLINDDTSSKSLLKDYNEANSVTFTAPYDGKRHSLEINVKDKYAEVDVKVQDTKKMPMTLINGTANISSAIILDAGLQANTKKIIENVKYTISVQANSNTTVLYQYLIKESSASEWTVLKDYNEAKAYEFSINKAGEYSVGVHVKDKFSGEKLDDYKYISVSVFDPNKAKLNKFEVLSNNVPTVECNKGNEYVLAADATSPNGSLYEFWIADLSTFKWEKLNGFSANKSKTFIVSKPGKYRVLAYAKDTKSKNILDDEKYLDIEVKDINKAQLNKFVVLSKGSPTVECIKGNEYVLSAAATSPNGPLYEFWIADLSTFKWEKLNGFSTNNSKMFIVSKPGKYRVLAYAKDPKSMIVLDDEKYVDIEVKDVDKAQLKSFEVLLNGKATTQCIKGNEYVLAADAISQNGPLYEFWIADLSTFKWEKLNGYSTNSSKKFTVSKPGKYRVLAYAKDKNSKNALDCEKYVDIEVKDISKAQLNKFEVLLNGTPTTECITNNEYVLSAGATSPNGPLYEFWIADLSTFNWVKLNGYSTNSSKKFTVSKPGKYRVLAYSKDKNSKNALDCEKYVDIEVKDISKAQLNKFEVLLNGTPTTECITNNEYVLSAGATSPNGPLYEFWIADLSTFNWVKLNGYSTNSSKKFTVSKPGKYRVLAYAKDKNSKNALDCEKYVDIEVKDISKAQLNKFEVLLNGTPTTECITNNEYVLSAGATSPNGPLYEFWIADLSTFNWVKLNGYSTNSSKKFTVSKPGKYRVLAYAKDKNSKNALDCEKYVDIEVKGAETGPGGNVVKKKLVLDAGHGNSIYTNSYSDSGAIGIGGLKESYLTRVFIEKLGQYLSKYEDIEVIYTHNLLNPYKDISDDLRQRVDIANFNSADLFVSIHFDSFTSPSANGVGTFYSSYRPELDKDGIVTEDGKKIDKTPTTQALLSKEFAGKVSKCLADVGFSDRGVRDSNLYVTQNTKMPSILIEGGFLTNKGDLDKITNPQIQDSMMRVLGDAISIFLKNK